MLNWAGSRRLVIVPLLAIVAVFAFAACSDDDDDGGNGGSTETPGATATDAPTDAPTEAPDGDPAAFDVDMVGFTFSPRNLTVTAGETVTFDLTNSDGVTHNMHIASNVTGEGEDVTGDYEMLRCDGSEDPCSEPASMAGGVSGTLEWTAPSEAGSVQFRCDFHPSTMLGVITVE